MPLLHFFIQVSVFHLIVSSSDDSLVPKPFDSRPCIAHEKRAEIDQILSHASHVNSRHLLVYNTPQLEDCIIDFVSRHARGDLNLSERATVVVEMNWVTQKIIITVKLPDGQEKSNEIPRAKFSEIGNMMCKIKFKRILSKSTDVSDRWEGIIDVNAKGKRNESHSMIRHLECLYSGSLHSRPCTSQNKGSEFDRILSHSNSRHLLVDETPQLEKSIIDFVSRYGDPTLAERATAVVEVNWVTQKITVTVKLPDGQEKSSDIPWGKFSEIGNMMSRIKFRRILSESTDVSDRWKGIIQNKSVDLCILK